jgi:hypothetical protein
MSGKRNEYLPWTFRWRRTNRDNQVDPSRAVIREPEGQANTTPGPQLRTPLGWRRAVVRSLRVHVVER